MKYLSVLFTTLTLVVSGFAGAAEFSVMSYNVENLWNAVEEEDQGDPSFLPQEIKESWTEDRCKKLSPYYRRFCKDLDWTEDDYEHKLQANAKVVLTYNDGLGPDIVSFQELENRSVLEDLMEELNRQIREKDDRFQYGHLAHFESDGFRGIDVGLISRVPVLSSDRRHVDFGSDGKGDTRDVLIVEFGLDGKRFYVLANHWPSQGGKTWKRIKASNVVKDLALDRENVIVIGDFNTLEGERSKEGENPVGRLGLVDLGRDEGQGTYFYKRQKKWNRFDRILIDDLVASGDEGIQYLSSSFEVLAPDFALEDFTRQKKGFAGRSLVRFKTTIRIPKGYDHKEATGYSDHLPVVARFETD